LRQQLTGGHIVRFANHTLGVIDRDGCSRPVVLRWVPSFDGMTKGAVARIAA
jgi:hypothetical protein